MDNENPPEGHDIKLTESQGLRCEAGFSEGPGHGMFVLIPHAAFGHQKPQILQPLLCGL